MQILSDLRRAGLIDSRRGKSGGYLLGRAPEAITLRQVVAAVDPSLLQCSVASEGQSGPSVRLAWDQVSSSLQQALDQITVATLANNPAGPMFDI